MDVDENSKGMDEILKHNDVKMNILCVKSSIGYAPHFKIVGDEFYPRLEETMLANKHIFLNQ